MCDLLRNTAAPDRSDDFLLHPELSLCFTGHRRIPPATVASLRKRIDESICRTAEAGIRYYLCGAALGFDTIVAEEVLRLRAVLPDIRLILVFPCQDQSSRWTSADRKRYEEIRKQADQTICLSERYYQGCMLTRNRYLVDHSSLCLCYLYSFKGGTWYTVRYACEKQLQIINLAIPEESCRFQLKEDNTWNSTFIFRSAKRNAPIAILPPFPIRRKRWRLMLRR